jgi:hypothetical protein
MTNSKIIATVLLVAGVVILLVSALADILGLGDSPHVLGYRQMAGIAVGAIVTIVGAVVYWRTGGRA